MTSNFKSRNRSLVLASDSKMGRNSGDFSRLNNLKLGNEDLINLSKTQFRRNVLSNIFGQSPKNGRRSTLTNMPQNDFKENEEKGGTISQILVKS